MSAGMHRESLTAGAAWMGSGDYAGAERGTVCELKFGVRGWRAHHPARTLLQSNTCRPVMLRFGIMMRTFAAGQILGLSCKAKQDSRLRNAAAVVAGIGHRRCLPGVPCG